MNWNGDMEAMFNMMMKAASGGGNWGGYSGGGKVKGTAQGWKQTLQQAYSKTNKEQATKATFSYETSPNEDGKGFVCALSSEKFSASYTGKGVSKSQAEDKAAQAAVKAEFPDYAVVAPVASNPRAKAGTGGWGMDGFAAMMGGAPQQQQQQPQCERWVVVLRHTHQKKFKTLTKEDSVSVSVEKSDDGQYACTITATQFAGGPYSGESSVRKDAEDSAAKAAMQSEFAEEAAAYAHLPVTSADREKAETKVEKRGAKRKQPEPFAAEAQSAKTKLMNGVTLLTGSCQKGTVVFEMSEGDNQTTCNVTINTLQPPQAFSGEPQPGTGKKAQRAAEESASEAALAALQDQIDVVKAAHDEKKAAKKKESRDSFLASKGKRAKDGPELPATA